MSMIRNRISGYLPKVDFSRLATRLIRFPASGIIEKESGLENNDFNSGIKT
jgi:hypothetical protein